MQPGIVLKKLNGKRARVEQKPSAKTIIENLVHWTVTLISKDGWRMECIFSNEKTWWGIFLNYSSVIELLCGSCKAEAAKIASCPMTRFPFFCRMLATLIGQLVSYKRFTKKNRLQSKDMSTEITIIQIWILQCWIQGNNRNKRNVMCPISAARFLSSRLGGLILDAFDLFRPRSI